MRINLDDKNTTIYLHLKVNFLEQKLTFFCFN